MVYFFLPCAPCTPLPPWAETRSHEYPRLAGEATDFGCGHRSGLGRARDFWCWNDLEWTGCSRVTGHRTETTVIFFLELGAVPMRGSRRWRQNGLYCKAYRPWPAREDSSTGELASPILGSAQSSRTAVRLLCELAIDPFLNDGCPREKKGNGCPRAQRARACCQEPAGRSAAPARVQ